MTDQDDLRDRIARVIHREECACGEDVAEEWELRWAQVIIDEFGLTVEMRVSSVGRTVDRRTGIVTNSTQTRIVGKWEKQ